MAHLVALLKQFQSLCFSLWLGYNFNYFVILSPFYCISSVPLAKMTAESQSTIRIKSTARLFLDCVELYNKLKVWRLLLKSEYIKEWYKGSVSLR